MEKSPDVNKNYYIEVYNIEETGGYAFRGQISGRRYIFIVLTLVAVSPKL